MLGLHDDEEVSGLLRDVGEHSPRVATSGSTSLERTWLSIVGSVQQAINHDADPPRFSFPRGAHPSEQQQQWQTSRGEWAATLLTDEREGGQRQPEEKGPHQERVLIPHSGAVVVCSLIQAALTFVVFELGMRMTFPIFQAHVAIWFVISCLLAAAVAYVLGERSISLSLFKAIRKLTEAVQCAQKDEPPCVFDCLTEVGEIWNAIRHMKGYNTRLARFVPRAIADGIMRAEFSSAGQLKKRYATVAFAHMREFPRITSELPLHDLVLVFYRYVTVVVRIMELFQATVAEIHHDGIVAYWGADVDVDNHPEKACTAAVAIVEAARLLNTEFQRRSLASIKIGIGIHTGPLMSGVLGCYEKMKWGCMGDTVNLASRIATLCELYDAPILCSRKTYTYIPQGVFLCRRIESVQVRGREQSVIIYEVRFRDDEQMPGSSAGSQTHTMSLHEHAVSLGHTEFGDRRSSWPCTWSKTPEDEHFFETYEKALLAFELGLLDVAFGSRHSWEVDSPLTVLSSYCKSDPALEHESL
eukprot:CAMPEP_0117471890 /NCGR_PEP_ID=MMETSP0784-20121206/7963_1 /TAXON_ID=39447 /ORGANISM="" /LENGTH=527 /DNA_ID=CAMNT_0005266021 /DNA_START=46 /DNA_END=1630 /DNA_ORIENTATION=+